jgi:hypothetical protein
MMLNAVSGNVMRARTTLIAAAILVAGAWLSTASADDAKPVRVTVDNFRRAESDTYFARFVKEGGFGKFKHDRELAPIDNQTVIRLNRDTLYSFGVFDLDTAPVTVTLPDAGTRYMALQVIDEDQYALDAFSAPGGYTLTVMSVLRASPAGSKSLLARASWRSRAVKHP